MLLVRDGPAVTAQLSYRLPQACSSVEMMQITPEAAYAFIWATALVNVSAIVILGAIALRRSV